MSIHTVPQFNFEDHANPHNRKNFGGQREIVLLRDDRMCVICSKTTKLCVHHIDKNRQNNTLENLATLCSSCHGKIHAMDKWITFKNTHISQCLWGLAICHRCVILRL